jgi:SAM-dependent methyltransferase
MPRQAPPTIQSPPSTTSALPSYGQVHLPTTGNQRGVTRFPPPFHTDTQYTDRQTKARYVYEKYKDILKGNILDVGADQGFLKSHLPNDTNYMDIGFGDGLDLPWDLEQGALPFENHTFDCVLCLDVLEHLDNLHEMFDELCRVSRNYVIIALPNPWSEVWKALLGRPYRQFSDGSVQPTKFYGLPVDPPADRHKWFFSHDEACTFIHQRAARNMVQVVQIDSINGKPERKTWKRWLIERLLKHPIPWQNLYAGTVWAVLQHPPASASLRP